MTGKYKGLRVAVGFAGMALIPLLSASAKEEPTLCVPISGQYHKVSLPNEIGKLISDDEHSWSGPTITYINKSYIAYKFELGDDGATEYLIRTNPEGPSAVGKNNPVWIVRRTEKGYEEMLEDFAKINGGPIVLKSKTNGYHDICVIRQGGAADKSYTIYHFDQNSMWYKIFTCISVETDPYTKSSTTHKCEQ